jgi:hypothetical protein
MPKRRTHADAVRDRQVSIRITSREHAKLEREAREHGFTIAGLAERKITQGGVVVQGSAGTLDAGTLYELKRIGNNLNQIAHAVNGQLPPEPLAVAKNLNGLVQILLRHHYFAARIPDAMALERQNDSTAPQAREEFQRSAALRPPRREGEHD